MRLRSSGNRERSGSNMAPVIKRRPQARQNPSSVTSYLPSRTAVFMSVGIHLAPSSASRTVSPSRVLMSLTGCALSWLLPASKTTTPVTASGLAPQPPRVPPVSPTRLLGPSADAGVATRIWCTSARLRRLCARPPVVWPPFLLDTRSPFFCRPIPGLQRDLTAYYLKFMAPNHISSNPLIGADGRIEVYDYETGACTRIQRSI